ncbi:MAG: hypothetical protein RLY47_237 [Candidatus Parcubacteria bacterium]|jgi:type IV secretory pathway VirB2 component (pilin)
MKKTFSYLASASILTVASIASAAPSDYLIVKDLPFIGQSADFGSYLNGLFQLGIGIAVTLAVVMLVINGIQYMFSDIPGVKIASKNNLGNIVWGLILAFSAWLILYTINPNLVKFDLVRSLDQAADAAISGAPPPPTPTDDGEAWPSDASEREALLAAGIGINNANCTTIGQRGCTSVHGLTQGAIEGLINLKSRCVAAQPSCRIIVTAGTEYWLHNTHRDNRTVDLRQQSGINAYIGGAGGTCFQGKVKDGLTFHWEDAQCGPGVAPHWHVSF